MELIQTYNLLSKSVVFPEQWMYCLVLFAIFSLNMLINSQYYHWLSKTEKNSCKRDHLELKYNNLTIYPVYIYLF